MRSGDIGDEAGRSTGDAGPLDLDAVRADDDLIEALSAGLVPPPCGPRDTSDIEGELVALLAGWVADVRPETLLHRPDQPPVAVPMQTARHRAENTAVDTGGRDASIAALFPGTPSLLEFNELPRPVVLAAWRSRKAWRSPAVRTYLLRAAAALVAVALVSSGVVARSYGAHPGEPLWAITQMAFPAKSHSVEAAISVSTALNTARVALERGRIDEARQAFQTVAAQLADVDPDDGRVELGQQMDYVHAQLVANPGATAAEAPAPVAVARPLATGAVGAVIPSSPAVTPGATAALDAPVIPPSVLAAAPNGTFEGSQAVGTAPAPAIVAAPAPSDGSAASAPVVSDPSADGASNSVPPVVSNPANDPVASASTTTQQQAPTPDPPVRQPTTDQPTPNTPAPVDSATVDQSNPPTGGGDTTSDNGGGGGGGNSDSSANSANTQNSADTQNSNQPSAIDTSGTAGSTIGQVSGVTSTSDSGS